MRAAHRIVGIIFGVVLTGSACWGQAAKAPDLYAILDALGRDPAYAGAVLVTLPYHPDPNSPDFIYEVRILATDDRILIVHVDPMTGQTIPAAEPMPRRHAPHRPSGPTRH